MVGQIWPKNMPCYGVNFWVPPNSCVEILMPSYEWDFGRCFSREGGVLQSCLVQCTPPCKDMAGSQQSAVQKKCFSRTWPCWHPDLGLLSLHD